MENHYQRNKSRILAEAKIKYQQNKSIIRARGKQYYENNKELHKQRRQEYYTENKDATIAQVRSYQNKNKGKVKEYMAEYLMNNREYIRQKTKEYRNQNKEQLNSYMCDYIKKRRELDSLYATKLKLRSVVYGSFKRLALNKPTNTEMLLGCSWEDAKAHIESKFQPGMTWQNMGEWHIDHIKPVASFIESDIHLMNRIENLQPLWAFENLSKGSKYLTAQ